MFTLLLKTKISLIWQMVEIYQILYKISSKTKVTKHYLRIYYCQKNTFHLYQPLPFALQAIFDETIRSMYKVGLFFNTNFTLYFSITTYLPLSSSTSTHPPPCNHHTVVYISEFFLSVFFAQSLHFLQPLPPPARAVSLLSV